MVSNAQHLNFVCIMLVLLTSELFLFRKISCMIVADFSLRCFGGGNSDTVASLAPTASVENGFGNFGQIGSGNNETLGDEVSAITTPASARAHNQLALAYAFVVHEPTENHDDKPDCTRVQID